MSLNYERKSKPARDLAYLIYNAGVEAARNLRDGNIRIATGAEDDAVSDAGVIYTNAIHTAQANYNTAARLARIAFDSGVTTAQGMFVSTLAPVLASANIQQQAANWTYDH